MLRLFRSLVFVVLATACSTAVTGPQRVVAIGDIHGEYDGFTSILRQAGLVDQQLRWSGGNARFVQTGDFVDRGADVRKVMDFLMGLERSARRGRVTVLLGNHELMDLATVFVNVNPAVYASFADRRSDKRRESGYRDYAALNQRLEKRYPGAKRKILSEAEWMDAHPPGFIEYVEALGRNGKYGRWLRTKAIAAKVNDTVFVHGGISPAFPATSIEQINEDARVEIEGVDRIREYLIAEGLILPFSTLDEMEEVADLESKRPKEDVSEPMQRVVAAVKSFNSWSVFAPTGPLWFRGYSEWSEEEGVRQIATVLERFGAHRFVVGHTVEREGGQIVARFGGKVFLIDTGMLRGYVKNGRPSALEIAGESISAIYETERTSLATSDFARPQPYLVASLGEELPAAPYVWLGPKQKPLPFRTTQETAAFLRKAKIVKVQRQKLSGVTKSHKVLVEGDGIRANAIFRSFHREEENARWESGTFTEFLRDSYRSEIAAYELSLLLGLDTVPPTVPRTLDGVPGALQLWIEKAVPGYHPQETRKPADPVRWAKERDKMRPWDALVRNTDRHEMNMLIDQRGKVWWIDHSRAFGRERDLIEPDLITRCDRVFYERLKSVRPEAIAEVLQPYMGPKEIDAVLDRRLKLIALIDERIAARGESEVLFTLDP